MSANNGQNNAYIMVFAIVSAALMFLAYAVIAIAAFAALVLTVLSVFAWNKPLKIGRFILAPKEARSFVSRGFWGMVILPLFAAFCSVLFGIVIPDSYWIAIYLAGYVLGSIGGAILLAEEKPEVTPPAAMPPQVPQPSQPEQLSTPPRKPFEYASWDDEADTK